MLNLSPDQSLVQTPSSSNKAERRRQQNLLNQRAWSGYHIPYFPVKYLAPSPDFLLTYIRIWVLQVLGHNYSNLSRQDKDSDSENN